MMKESEAEASAPGKPRASHPRLTEERLQRLNSIGFEWSKDENVAVSILFHEFRLASDLFMPSLVFFPQRSNTR